MYACGVKNERDITELAQLIEIRDSIFEKIFKENEPFIKAVITK